MMEGVPVAPDVFSEFLASSGLFHPSCFSQKPHGTLDFLHVGSGPLWLVRSGPLSLLAQAKMYQLLGSHYLAGEMSILLGTKRKVWVVLSYVFYCSCKWKFMTDPLSYNPPAVVLPLRENQIKVHVLLSYFHCDLGPIRQDLPCLILPKCKTSGFE